MWEALYFCIYLCAQTTDRYTYR